MHHYYGLSRFRITRRITNVSGIKSTFKFPSFFRVQFQLIIGVLLGECWLDYSVKQRRNKNAISCNLCVIHEKSSLVYRVQYQCNNGQAVVEMPPVLASALHTKNFGHIESNKHHKKILKPLS